MIFGVTLYKTRHDMNDFNELKNNFKHSQL